MQHISSIEQPTYILTKSFSVASFVSLRIKLSVIHMPFNLRGGIRINEESKVDMIIQVSHMQCKTDKVVGDRAHGKINLVMIDNKDR